jgi:hypothetical protein
VALLVAALGLTLTPSATAGQPAGQGGYHVSPKGSDSNPGTARAPFATIQHALDEVPEGSVIRLKPGVYHQDFVTRRENVTITGPRAAVVKGGGEGRVIQIQHDGTTLSGFTVDGLHGDPDDRSGYRSKLIYVMSTTPGDGVDDLTIRNMELRNGGGECLRLRYLVTGAEIAHNTITNCGIYDYRFDNGGKNGEAIYLGTAPAQQGRNGAPDDRPDVSRDNWIHSNVIDTQGNECVDIKENSTANLVENNDCTGQLDPDSAGLDARGSGNIFRGNRSYNNLGAGIRVGGHLETDGTHTDMYDNVLFGNGVGGIKIMRAPQGRVCGNTLYDNVGGDTSGTYRNDYTPGAPCEPDPEPVECEYTYPGEVLDLTNWKINLPSGEAGTPTEIKQPELDTYFEDPWFKVNDDCDGVQFRAPVNGNTTPNSRYSRSELREMTDNGTEHAAWSAASGTHMKRKATGLVLSGSSQPVLTPVSRVSGTVCPNGRGRRPWEDREHDTPALRWPEARPAAGGATRR